MKTYIVLRRECWVSGVEIEAANEEEALLLVAVGEGTERDDLLEYSHTMDVDSWTVEEKE